MFTLKLYRRVNPDVVITKVLSVHHVQAMSFEQEEVDRKAVRIYTNKAIELWAFHGPEPSAYDSYLVGDREKFKPVLKHTGVLRPEDDWWGWGLLENEAGRTTEHYRPANFG